MDSDSSLDMSFLFNSEPHNVEQIGGLHSAEIFLQNVNSEERYSNEGLGPGELFYEDYKENSINYHDYSSLLFYTVLQNPYVDFLKNEYTKYNNFMDAYNLLSTPGSLSSYIVEKELRVISNLNEKKIFKRKLQSKSFCEPFSFLPVICSKALVRGTTKDKIRNYFFYGSDEILKIRDIEIRLFKRKFKVIEMKLYYEGEILTILRGKSKGSQEACMNNLFSVLKHLSLDYDCCFLGTEKGEEIEHSTGIYDLFTTCLNGVSYKEIQFLSSENLRTKKPVLKSCDPILEKYGPIVCGCLFNFFENKFESGHVFNWAWSTRSDFKMGRSKNWQKKRFLVDLAYILSYFGIKRDFKISNIPPTIKVREHVKMYDRVEVSENVLSSWKLTEDAEKIKTIESIGEYESFSKIKNFFEETQKVREIEKESIAKSGEKKRAILSKTKKLNSDISSLKGSVLKRINISYLEKEENKVKGEKLGKLTSNFPQFTPYKDAILKIQRKIGKRNETIENVDLSNFIFNWEKKKKKIIKIDEDNLNYSDHSREMKIARDYIECKKSELYIERKNLSKVKKRDLSEEQIKTKIDISNKFDILSKMKGEYLTDEGIVTRLNEGVKPVRFHKICNIIAIKNRSEKMINRAQKKFSREKNTCGESLFKKLKGDKLPKKEEIKIKLALKGANLEFEEKKPDENNPGKKKRKEKRMNSQKGKRERNMTKLKKTGKEYYELKKNYREIMDESKNHGYCKYLKSVEKKSVNLREEKPADSSRIYSEYMKSLNRDGRESSKLVLTKGLICYKKKDFAEIGEINEQEKIMSKIDRMIDNHLRKIES